MAKTPAAVRRSKSPAAKLATKAKVWRAFQPLKALVRVIDDKTELTRLCQRPAPGADRAVKFDEDLLAYCGREAIVRRISKSRRAYDLWVKRGGSWYADYFPFDACILVDEEGAPSDDDIQSPDEVDSDDESDAEPDA